MKSEKLLRKYFQYRVASAPFSVNPLAKKVIHPRRYKFSDAFGWLAMLLMLLHYFFLSGFFFRTPAMFNLSFIF